MSRKPFTPPIDIVFADTAARNATVKEFRDAVDGWNYDMSQAPKGTTTTVKRKGPRGPIDVEIFTPAYVILAADDDWQTVTKSHWIPPFERDGYFADPSKKHVAGRWEFFAIGQQPLAWRPYPTHPKAGVEP